MNKSQAIADIVSIFQRYRTLTPSDRDVLDAFNQGKLYELYVLSELLVDLRNRGCELQFTAQTLRFKGAPGRIRTEDPHFCVIAPNGRPLWLFVDIEFNTLGNSRSNTTDRSRRHALDIVLVDAITDYPDYDDILLAVECKSVATFHKGIVKEALGIRRELSYLARPSNSSLTTLGGRPAVTVRARPTSEFWLAFIHIDGNCYADSPAAFSIDFKHIEP